MEKREDMGMDGRRSEDQALPAPHEQLQALRKIELFGCLHFGRERRNGGETLARAAAPTYAQVSEEGSDTVFVRCWFSEKYQTAPA